MTPQKIRRTAKEVIAAADVEFLHGVPVHPTERGAEAILQALHDAGYFVVHAPSQEMQPAPPLTDAEQAERDFDVVHNVEPARTLAERIAVQYLDGDGDMHSLVDDIAHTIEDARDLGEKRARLLQGEKS